ncbi:hypothetical protein [Hyphomonas sp.]|uniref:hypothetical protein n=1 Tax=Hyphomonas sp. TaxID=87 RepID=UPI00391B76C8
MSGNVASAVAAVILLGGAAGGIIWATSEDVARQQARQASIEHAAEGAAEASAIMDKYLTPEERFAGKRADNLARMMQDEAIFEAPVYEADQRAWLYHLAARLIVDGHCSLAEVKARPPEPVPSTGHLPMYQAFCPGKSGGKVIYLYPATREYAVTGAD